MSEVQALAVEQLTLALKLIKSGERIVRRINTGYHKGEVTDISIELMPLIKRTRYEAD
jgi:hypothetical protein